MAKLDQLDKEAARLYRKGQYREAALTGLQASDISKEMKDAAQWYKHRAWAAASFNSANDYVKAMDLLLDLRLHEPMDRPDYEAWVARTKLIEITLKTNPSNIRLNELMQELKSMALEQTVPEADILFLEGHIYQLKGRLLDALHCFEESWQKDNGSGYFKYVYAKNAASICLDLNKLDQVKDWLSASSKTNEDHQERLEGELAIKLTLSLAEQKPTPVLKQALREYEDAVILIQANESQDSYNQLKTRVNLLTYRDIDPLKTSHPAKQSVTIRLCDYKNVHNQYNQRLLLIDFRLASLRYCIGITAVDDLYYTQPQQLRSATTEFNRLDFKKRSQHALISCNQAEKYAKKIDDLLECHWRQKQVQQRRERILEIINHDS